MKKTKQSSTFGQRLREERERLGLAQEAFAELGGVKRITQHFYESSERSPDARYLQALMEHGVDVTFLFTGKRAQLGPVTKGLSPELRNQVYVAVEEFARDAKGNPMDQETKLNLFSFLCAAFEDVPGVDAEGLRERLQRLKRSA